MLILLYSIYKDFAKQSLEKSLVYIYIYIYIYMYTQTRARTHTNTHIYNLYIIIKI